MNYFKHSDKGSGSEQPVLVQSSLVFIREFKTTSHTGLFEMIVQGFNNLPPRSPDSTPCDFFLGGYVKI